MGMLPAEFVTDQVANGIVVLAVIFVLPNCALAYRRWHKASIHRDDSSQQAKVELYAYAARLQATPEDVQ